MENKLEEAEWV